MTVTFNKDKKTVASIKKALQRKDGFCPCRTERIEDNLCMCREFREQISDPEFEGYCHCGLYYKSR